MPLLVLALLVVAGVVDAVEVVEATGVKVPAGTRLLGEFVVPVCPLASAFAAAIKACAGVWVAVPLVLVVVPELAVDELGVAADELELVEVTYPAVVVEPELDVLLEDGAGRRGTKATEKLCPLLVFVLMTGVPVATVAVGASLNSV